MDPPSTHKLVKSTHPTPFVSLSVYTLHRLACHTPPATHITATLYHSLQQTLASTTNIHAQVHQTRPSATARIQRSRSSWTIQGAALFNHYRELMDANKIDRTNYSSNNTLPPTLTTCAHSRQATATPSPPTALRPWELPIPTTSSPPTAPKLQELLAPNLIQDHTNCCSHSSGLEDPQS